MGQKASRTDASAAVPTDDASDIDRVERGAMEAALAELSRALDAEDLSTAVTVSGTALSKWPRWRALRASRDRTAGYLAACTSATTSAPPALDIDSLRVTDVDEASLPQARAERTAEHISRMADVLPHVFGCLAREPAPERFWTSAPLLDKLIETSIGHRRRFAQVWAAG